MRSRGRRIAFAISSTIAANVAAPGAAIDDLGGYVINLATSTPVNGCDRTAARVGKQL